MGEKLNIVGANDGFTVLRLRRGASRYEPDGSIYEERHWRIDAELIASPVVAWEIIDKPWGKEDYAPTVLPLTGDNDTNQDMRASRQISTLSSFWGLQYPDEQVKLLGPYQPIELMESTYEFIKKAKKYWAWDLEFYRRKEEEEKERALVEEYTAKFIERRKWLPKELMDLQAKGVVKFIEERGWVSYDPDGKELGTSDDPIVAAFEADEAQRQANIAAAKIACDEMAAENKRIYAAARGELDPDIRFIEGRGWVITKPDGSEEEIDSGRLDDVVEALQAARAAAGGRRRKKPKAVGE